MSGNTGAGLGGRYKPSDGLIRYPPSRQQIAAALIRSNDVLTNKQVVEVEARHADRWRRRIVTTRHWQWEA